MYDLFRRRRIREYKVHAFTIYIYTCDWLSFDEGLDGGVWYSLFIKNLAHYSSHLNFGLFIKIRPINH